jgi:hypothetical protein
MDGDGKPGHRLGDFAATAVVELGSGGGGFALSGTDRSARSRARSCRLDGDGDLDVVTANRTQGHLDPPATAWADSRRHAATAKRP